jgi:murein L,D-transpeptidase YafK
VRKRFVLSVAIVALGVLGAVKVSAFVAQDRCLDLGGAWYGALGCEFEKHHVDRIIVDKSDRRLMAYEDGKLLRTFSVALGRNPVGQKQMQGDKRTPEGVYPITEHKLDSAYHRAVRLGYPTPAQRDAAAEKGIDPGGDIMIHGLPNGFGSTGIALRNVDWTAGCIALTNDEIEWLYAATADGVLVEIRA